MNYLIEKIIKLRNPSFKFDDSMPFKHILALTTIKLISHIRAYKLLLRGRIPKTIFLGSNVSFEALDNISWGKWLKINKQTLLSSYGRESKIEIGNNVSIGAYSSFIVSSSLSTLGRYIKIGNNVGFGDYTHIGGLGGVEIGENTIIGAYFSCHPSNHNFEDAIKLIRLQGISRQGIKIGSNCWVGAKVTILDGVTIGDGCIIAAGSVVTKSFDKNSIIGGVPTKLIKIRIMN